MKILEKLKPVFNEDVQEWEEILSQIDEIPPLFWYAGAGFDTKPIVAFFDGTVPLEVKENIPNSIFPVMTDYAKKYVEEWKKIYRDFDKPDFDLNQFYIKWPNNYPQNLREVEIVQMIPFTFWTPEELKRIREEYTEFHSYMTDSVVPDDLWHCVYVDFGDVQLFYFMVENLVFWKEVVEKYSLKIDAFCALQMGGKSGSWDHPHSPKDGVLFNAIKNSNVSKPKIWIADQCEELREIWREIEPHDNGFYGVMHYFKAEWD